MGSSRPLVWAWGAVGLAVLALAAHERGRAEPPAEPVAPPAAPPAESVGTAFPYGARGLDLPPTHAIRRVVEAGLRTLARAQTADGRWPAGHPEQLRPE